MMKETILYEKFDDNKVKCGICPWRCVLKPGKLGNCGTRENINGKLFSLTYASISSLAIDPMEKKPMYHFYPGNPILSISAVGCNFHCKHCQNWNISQVKATEARLREMSPEDVINHAKKQNCKHIAYTYNEPLIWLEYILDVAKLARENGMKNVLVTNGYVTLEAFGLIKPYIDGANVDIKAFTDEFYQKIVGVPSIKPVLETVKAMHEAGILVEITNLIIPTKNDNMEEIKALCDWILNNLSDEVPLHFSKFHPMFQLNDVPSTPRETLENAYRTAKKVGLKYVYLGNIYVPKTSNTYCPNCEALIIERQGYSISCKNLSDKNNCKKCNTPINIVGKCY
ncbi:MAG: AmmeMemoRadiSam system radical SAM enzyme [Candidatus Lokiarchaeota archaeon]|nr:AmmeMemoRadiSam system radical SAM enzyme [Candidatus Lokiarchaeota archaeon]